MSEVRARVTSRGERNMSARAREVADGEGKEAGRRTTGPGFLRVNQCDRSVYQAASWLAGAPSSHEAVLLCMNANGNPVEG